MWNHRSGECLRIFRFKSPPIYSLCVNKGRLFVGAGESCWVIDAFTGATGNRYNCRFGAINSIAVCSITDMLFVASGFVGQMFDMSNGKSLRSVAGHSGSLYFCHCYSLFLNTSSSFIFSFLMLNILRHYHQYPLPWRCSVSMFLFLALIQCFMPTFAAIQLVTLMW
jgi:hypothetical protein